MAVFTTAMPRLTGDAAEDTAELRAWACRLISELRCVLYSLDKENVKIAGSVMAEDIVGVIGEEKLPDIPADKLVGTADSVEVNAENGVVFIITDEKGNKEAVASLYYKSEGGAKGLHIDSLNNIYVNGGKLV